MNQFSHLTVDEVVAKFTGSRLSKERFVENSFSTAFMDDDIDVPESIDWRDSGAVNPVKSQGVCSSSWAFASTAAVEAVWKLSGKELESLSEQQLVDCSSDFGN